MQLSNRREPTRRFSAAEASAAAATMLGLPGFVGRLLDVVEDRTARAVSGWLADGDADFRRQVGLVALDPRRAFANAISRHRGHAARVVDR